MRKFDRKSRSESNWRSRLKGRALGKRLLQEWHTQCAEKRRKQGKTPTRSAIPSSFNGERIMAAMDETKKREVGGRTKEYRGSGFYGQPKDYLLAGYGVRDIPMLKAKGLI